MYLLVPPRVEAIPWEIAAALEAAHEQRIIHRDQIPEHRTQNTEQRTEPAHEPRTENPEV
jgi:hypothetical protein